MDFPSFRDLFRIARDEILARNPLITRDAVERDGSDANIIVAGMAAVGDELVGQLIDAQAGLYLDSAEKEALARLIFDRYGLSQKAAAAAVGEIQFTTPVAVGGPFTIPSGLTLQTADGVQFLTIADVTFPGGSSGPVPATVRSVLAGADQQARAGTITSIVGTIPGSPAGLVVTNALATAGASDAESDPDYRDRARRFFSTARRGTVAAIEAGALAVPGIATASAFEALDALGRPDRLVTLVVADAYTDALADLGVVPPAYQTQSQALALTVFAALDDVRAGGIYVSVSVAQVILQAVQLGLTFMAGADANVVSQNARAVIVGYVNGLSPGHSFVPADAVNALRMVSGLVITGREIVSPSGSVVVNPLQALRTTLSLVNSLR